MEAVDIDLDFSVLDNLAYRGIDTEEERENRDQLTAKGFTLVEADTANPFQMPQKAPESPNKPEAVNTQPEPQRRSLPPFTGHESGRNYRAMYRAACNFHEKYNPSTWGGDIASKEGLDSFFLLAANEMLEISRQHENDAFIDGLLLAVYAEIERETKAINHKEDTTK